MEAVGPDSCGGGDTARGAEGRPAPEARVHFRVTRFIMEAGNRGWGEGRPYGNPLPGEGDAQDGEVARLARGKRPGSGVQASAFRRALCARR